MLQGWKETCKLEIQKTQCSKCRSQYQPVLQTYPVMITPYSLVNPFLLHMNFRVTFKSWLNHTREVIETAKLKKAMSTDATPVRKEQKKFVVLIEQESHVYITCSDGDDYSDNDPGYNSQGTLYNKIGQGQNSSRAQTSLTKKRTKSHI